jgi:hypothetical protein
LFIGENLFALLSDVESGASADSASKNTHLDMLQIFMSAFWSAVSRAFKLGVSIKGQVQRGALPFA